MRTSINNIVNSINPNLKLTESGYRALNCIINDVVHRIAYLTNQMAKLPSNRLNKNNENLPPQQPTINNLNINKDTNTNDSNLGSSIDRKRKRRSEDDVFKSPPSKKAKTNDSSKTSNSNETIQIKCTIQAITALFGHSLIKEFNAYKLSK